MIGRVRFLVYGTCLLLACAGGTSQPTDRDAPVETAPSTATPEAGSGISFTTIAAHGPDRIAGLSVPGYIDVDHEGRLLVPNAGTAELLTLDASAQVVRRWGQPGDGPGQFGYLRDVGDPDSALGGVAVAADGSVFVVEAGNKRVQRFSASGDPELSWGSLGLGDGTFMDPIGVAIGPSEGVYVVDDVRDDIQVFTRSGEYVRTVGRQGSGPGQLAFTGNIRIRPDGTLVNADFGNGRVQAWDIEGQFLWSLGTHGTRPGQFVEPQDVAFGPGGSLFVVDDRRVQVFDADHRLIGSWPDVPLSDHLASIAVHGDTLWVVAPYAPVIFEVRFTTSGP